MPSAHEFSKTLYLAIKSSCITMKAESSPHPGESSIELNRN
jgi:hypothetical protein